MLYFQNFVINLKTNFRFNKQFSEVSLRVWLFLFKTEFNLRIHIEFNNFLWETVLTYFDIVRNKYTDELE